MLTFMLGFTAGILFTLFISSVGKCDHQIDYYTEGYHDGFDAGKESALNDNREE